MKKTSVKIEDLLLAEVDSTLSGYGITMQNMVKMCLETGIDEIKKNGFKKRKQQNQAHAADYAYMPISAGDPNKHPANKARDGAGISPEARLAKPRADGKTAAQLEAEALDAVNNAWR